MFLTGLKQENIDIAEKKRNRTFTNLAPYLRGSYNFSQMFTMQLSYSGATIQPSMEQLQPLRKSNNDLVIQEGNPDLVPGFNHNLSLSFNKYNFKKEIMMMASVNGSLQSNAITNATNFEGQNRRVSKYVNVDGLPGSMPW